MRASEGQYRHLKAALGDMAMKYDAAETEIARLEAILGQLRALILYHQNDREIADKFILRPLGALEAALYDCGRGAKVPLLDHAPERPGRPVRLAREDVQGSLAFAVELLVAGRRGTEAACEWVATTARRQGLRSEDGAPLTARQVKSWRAEISRGKAPAGACETFVHLRCMRPYSAAFRTASGQQPLPQQGYEVLAGAFIKGLAATAPRSGPKKANRR